MHVWQEDMLLAIEDSQISEDEIFGHLRVASEALGFPYCAYGLRVPIPVTRPQTVMLNNYPAAWQERYAAADYLSRDPTVLHGRRSQAPVLWSDDLFATARDLWDEARDHGLRVGWVQSSLDGHGVGGMVTLARSDEELTPVELEAKELRMRWLVNIAHVALSRRISPQLNRIESALTPREIEVLQWTADGKTAPEISDILDVSSSTVVFHVSNAMRKLNATSRTAAAVKAAMLGLLN
ncbi:autoinducer binding domain-containing protein [Piscinibacter koreensis]|uniref:Autoinducer binding domain-containing protein n=1 Tax=Piscinibacter koreensis TaxID=2742824 RepID=A0A7Y6TWC7_9BURK|nr:autoinducer binding domain-containing protein [Schlegelella koreensis]NUZ05882.1 autoinducer binding domain-containing protein [Schlegelella koreensis]